MTEKGKQVWSSGAPVFFAALCALLGACSFEYGPELNAPDAFAKAQADELTIIDIRTPKEWRQTGIGLGVHRIDMRQPGGKTAFLRKVSSLVEGDHNKPIGLICRTGNRSGKMQHVLLGAGFTNVFNIREGMAGSGAGPGWIRRGLPVEPCPDC
jgi:rhodanese-related sulfurtransferase